VIPKDRVIRWKLSAKTAKNVYPDRFGVNARQTPIKLGLTQTTRRGLTKIKR